MAFIQLASQAYEAGVHGLPPEKCVNLYPEALPQLADKQFGLIMTPGLNEFTTVGQGPIRGEFQQDGSLSDQTYVVSGPEVYTMQPDGSSALLGGIATGSGRTPLAASTTQLVAVTGPGAWIVDTDGTVTQITDPDFVDVSDVAFINGFFVFTRAGTGEIIWSAIGDGANYDALDFATAESSSDDLVGIKAERLQLILFGRETIEFWVPTNNADAPFQRRPGGAINFGTKSRDGIVQGDNTIYWVGNDNVIYRLGGGDAPQAVSTPFISEKLEAVPESQADRVRGWTYIQRGHRFFVFDIPGAGTFAFDPALNRWHERSTAGQELFRPLVYARLFGKSLVGDRTSNQIFELDPEIYTDDGDEVRRIASAYVPSTEQIKIGLPVTSFALDGIKGQGLETGQGSDPQVMMRYSDTGGNVWSNELWRAWGKIGEYATRTIWRRLGRFGPRGRVFEVSFSDPVNWVITGARINDEHG